MNFKLVVALCVGLGILYAAKHVWLASITAEIAAEAPNLPQPGSLPITVEPEALRQALEVGRAVDTTAQRTAIEDTSRRIEEMNRTMRPNITMPPNIPGMPRH